MCKLSLHYVCSSLNSAHRPPRPEPQCNHFNKSQASIPDPHHDRYRYHIHVQTPSDSKVPNSTTVRRIRSKRFTELYSLLVNFSNPGERNLKKRDTTDHGISSHPRNPSIKSNHVSHDFNSVLSKIPIQNSPTPPPPRLKAYTKPNQAHHVSVGEVSPIYWARWCCTQ